MPILGGTQLSLDNTWQDVFKEEAVISEGDSAMHNLEEEWPSNDPEDEDYDPERKTTTAASTLIKVLVPHKLVFQNVWLRIRSPEFMTVLSPYFSRIAHFYNLYVGLDKLFVHSAFCVRVAEIETRRSLLRRLLRVSPASILYF